MKLMKSGGKEKYSGNVSVLKKSTPIIELFILSSIWGRASDCTIRIVNFKNRRTLPSDSIQDSLPPGSRIAKVSGQVKLVR